MAFKDFPVPLNANTVSNSIRFTASGNGFDDETFIRFTNAATTNFDNQLDAWKLLSANPAAPNISSVINDSLNLSINALPGLNSAVTIPIRLLVPVTGNYSIRRDSTLMLPMSACVLLEDLATGSTIDLRQTISYSFSISDTTSAPRFLLHLFAPITKNSVNPVCSADSSGIAIAKGTGSGPWNYIWTNSNGDTLKQTSNSFSADSLTKLSAGIYSVEVSGSVCGTVRDTFQIKSASNLLAMLNYTDVSCYGKMDGEAHTIISGGVSPFTFLWSNGASTSAINNLSAGNYSVTVTDSLGCSQTQFAIISQPQQLISAFSASADTVNLFLSNSDSFMNSSAGATNYLWDFGDTTSTDTTKNPTHYYDHPGSYTVTLIAASGNCTDTSRKIITVIYDNATSLHEISNSSSVNIIYDNGEVFLDFNLSNETDISIAVYDMFGKKVIAQNEFQIQKKRIKLETSVLASGIYIAVSSMKEEIISKKIVIPSR